jgi:hypothetical protein
MNENNDKKPMAINKPELLKASSYVLAGVVIAFLLFAISDIGNKKPVPTSGNGNTQTASSTVKESFNWYENIRTVEKTIGSTFLDIETKEREPMSIHKIAEITGDKTDEALIALGSGGAYTEYLTLMRLNYANKDGSLQKTSKPIIAQFKLRDGSTGPLMFAEGSSVSHGETVELIPATNAVYSGGWSLDPVNPDAIECNLDVYIWNEKNSLFEFNKVLSESALASFCAKIASSR